MVEVTEDTPNPTSIHDLTPKMKLTGKVTRLDLYGAFVDIGVGRDALVHISKIRKGAINRVDEVLSVGENVTVYVDKIDLSTNRISLSMIKPLAVNWSELGVGQVYHGKITRLEPYGVFVDIGAERPGLVHISEMGDEFIRHPNELYAIGDHIDVRVINYDRKKRRIDLALSQEDPDTQLDDENEDETLTAMELAMRRALKESDNHIYPTGKRPTRRGHKRNQRVQNDILSRTLRNRRS